MLIDSPPQVLPDSADLDEHFVEMPLVAGSGRRPPQPTGVFGPEPGTPGADRLV